MIFLELDVDSLRANTISLCKTIPANFHPDFVAYLARGGYLMGCDAARFFDCPLVELDKHRTEYVKKETNLLRRLPRWAKHALREVERRFRNLFCDRKGLGDVRPAVLTKRYPLPAKASKILLIDDSIDSGASIVAGRLVLESLFPEATVRVAALNTFIRPSEQVSFDWVLFEDTLLSTPSSADSPFYEDFCRLYDTDGYR